MLRELLCDAIQRKQLLEFRYAKDDLVRVIEPHQIGETADGHELLLAWLARSESAPEQNGWRLFRTAQMSDVRALDECFEVPRPGFNPSARYFAVTHCSLLAEGAAVERTEGHAPSASLPEHAIGETSDG